MKRMIPSGDNPRHIDAYRIAQAANVGAMEAENAVRGV
jgi:hypothetical protein